ncbi:hypothetical protein BDB00DRAFT_784641 [Zychaea mexicana]|uniref:uncharacterized protein n=1 Tax=Zychaea mexicana TaxID=64656 RepID=UPI0022FF255A|nr:uncharacterized protein BDB00DRAFT_784641 [Zychaea mexicana]KAI9497720.1 hypothetical protein BDB00DRAFT_784641 [Zychaea mexicana]
MCSRTFGTSTVGMFGIFTSGYLHRDIKPNTIVVGVNDRDDRAYLNDFSLVKKNKFAGKHVVWREGLRSVGLPKDQTKEKRLAAGHDVDALCCDTPSSLADYVGYIFEHGYKEKQVLRRDERSSALSSLSLYFIGVRFFGTTRLYLQIFVLQPPV